MARWKWPAVHAGTPRIANSAAARVRDFAEVRHDGTISAEHCRSGAGRMLNVDAEGFDYMDRKLLLAVIDKFFGGPVGLDNLAAAIGEERETIEDVLEPHLIQQGFCSVRRGKKWRRCAPEPFRDYARRKCRSAQMWLSCSGMGEARSAARPGFSLLGWPAFSSC